MNENQRYTRTLFERKLLSQEDFIAAEAHRSLNLFSLRTELSFLLYAAVLMFTGGVGILIYENIDTFGHTAIILAILALTIVSFYFCFKKAPKFRWEETVFESPTYDYLVLLATILSCIFIGYVQIQYEPLGAGIGATSLLSALVAFFAAYYFDNRSALSIAITGLAAFIGITITPKAVLANEVYLTEAQTYSGILLGLILAIWAEVSERRNLKKHFRLVFVTFSLHLIGICCIKGLFETCWPIFLPILAGCCYYFYKLSYRMKAVSVFMFALIYAFIGLNILLGRLIDLLSLIDKIWPIFYLSPVYVILSIIGFIRMVKRFNTHADDSYR